MRTGYKLAVDEHRTYLRGTSSHRGAGRRAADGRRAAGRTRPSSCSVWPQAWPSCKNTSPAPSLGRGGMDLDNHKLEFQSLAYRVAVSHAIINRRAVRPKMKLSLPPRKRHSTWVAEQQTAMSTSWPELSVTHLTARVREQPGV